MKLDELKTTTATSLDANYFTLGNESLDDGIIAEFEAVITTSKEDRDHDIMHTVGAEIDHKMPLLWQHNPDKPIGKFLEVTHRDNQKISGKFAIADTPLGRDALTLVKLGALRISHGFKAHKATPRKGGKGYDVRRWTIVEGSLVSIPSNNEAIILALNEGKFHSPIIKSWAGSLDKNSNGDSEPMTTETVTNEYASNEAVVTAADVKSIVRQALKDHATAGDDGKKTTDNVPTVDELLNAGTKGGSGNHIVTKSPSSQYDGAKTTAAHAKTGAKVFNEFGREVQTVSQRDTALAGAFLKSLAARAGIAQASLDDHGRELLNECFNDHKWCGKFGTDFKSDVDGIHVKALLNDSTSGGSEAVPIFFDSDLISFPLLHSEIFPEIDLRPVPRGNSIEGASVSNPSTQWGTGEGTEIALFDTSSLVAAIDTTIHPLTIAIEVGRDFLADSPADVGRVLLENIGQKFSSELDRVTAVGNGTDEPEGIFTASGTVAVSSDNGNSGPPTLNDYESLMFAIGKQYRNQSMRPRFITNDTTYQRSRAIRIDAASPSVDQRPVFGLGAVNSYVTLDWPHRIENIGVANTEAGFGALSKYRMYRRMGMSAEWTTQGKELMRRNVALLVVRARFGGQVVDASAFAKIIDMQS